MLLFEERLAAIVGLFQSFEVPVAHPGTHWIAMARDEDSIPGGKVVVKVRLDPISELGGVDFDIHGAFHFPCLTAAFGKLINAIHSLRSQV
ncbi:MAG TPA: hypothetical protein VJ942_09175 [Roseovarius sp.]|nr:hypothetical protein [Roseovarius sp.]